MGPRRFFNHATEAVHSPASGLLIGPVGTDQDIVTHQVAIALNGSPGQESVTVLSADMDPNNNDLTTFTVSLLEGSDPQPEDIHVDEDDGTEALGLHMIDTVLGNVSIKLFQSDISPGIYDGLLKTRSHGSLIMQLYTAKYGDEAGYVLDANEYSEIQEEVLS
jgi:hypothetical protein